MGKVIIVCGSRTTLERSALYWVAMSFSSNSWKTSKSKTEWYHSTASAVLGAVAGLVRAGVLVALDEAMHGVAEGRDRRLAHCAVLVAQCARLLDGGGAAVQRGLVRLGDVAHAQCDGLDAVAVGAHVLGDLARRRQRRGDDEAHPALLQHVRGAVAHAGLGTGVGDHVEAEGAAIELRCLPGVADVELDVVGAEQHRDAGSCRCLQQLSHARPPRWWPAGDGWRRDRPRTP